jgi:hypothetical protein
VAIFSVPQTIFYKTLYVHIPSLMNKISNSVMRGMHIYMFCVEITVESKIIECWITCVWFIEKRCQLLGPYSRK